MVYVGSRMGGGVVGSVATPTLPADGTTVAASAEGLTAGAGADIGVGRTLVAEAATEGCDMASAGVGCMCRP